MKTKLIFITISLALLTFSCKKTDDVKENNYMNKGTITGIDMNLCMCCGGWFIEIDNATYRFQKLPDKCDLNLENEPFPVIVKLDWEKEKNPCLGDEIIVKRIVKN
jgi:hypothetical protein